jgi:hypothetical protein
MTPLVMAGLDPAIQSSKRFIPLVGWMAGSSLAMTTGWGRACL